MIRVVSLKKAITAGIAGAAVMEIFSLGGRLAGLNTVDLVQQLSTVDFPKWPLFAVGAALLVHLGTGVCWAVFYAFAAGVDRFLWKWLAPTRLVELVESLCPIPAERRPGSGTLPRPTAAPA